MKRKTKYLGLNLSIFGFGNGNTLTYLILKDIYSGSQKKDYKCIFFDQQQNDGAKWVSLLKFTL